MPDSMSISEHVYLHMEWLPSRLGVFSSIFGLHSRLCSLLQDSYLGFGYQGREPRNPNSQKEVQVLLVIKCKHQPLYNILKENYCDITVACTEKYVILYFSMFYVSKFKSYLMYLVQGIISRATFRYRLVTNLKKN